MNKTIYVALALTAVLLIFGLYRTNNKTIERSNSPTKESLDLVETEPVPPGDYVTIPKVILSKPGFVMIHKAEGDYPGEIVMTGDIIPVGESKNVVVRGVKTKSGESYFAMLHFDDGNGKYDNPSVDPPVTKGSSIVEEKFMISSPF